MSPVPSLRALPDFPWDSLAPYKERASSRIRAGIVDLSVGTPVDPTPDVVQAALRRGRRRARLPADLRHRRPARGRGRLVRPPPRRARTSTRTACCRRSAPRSWSPGCRPCSGLGAGDVVGIPGSRLPDLRRRRPARRGHARRSSTASTALGPLTAADHAEAVVAQQPQQPDRPGAGRRAPARWSPGRAQHGVVVASDECYAELDWRERARPEPTTPSILDPRVCGGTHEGLLAVYSLSKQSNLAGYRAAFVAGDPALVRRLLEVRKHAGMIVPVAGAAGHAGRARRRRPRRRAEGALCRAPGQRCARRSRRAGCASTTPRPASTSGPPAARTRWATVDALADRGILVAPGTFYGDGRREHVRIALTATDERIARRCRRGCVGLTAPVSPAACVVLG